MYFRRAANELFYVFKYRRFNYVMLCVEMYQKFCFNERSSNFSYQYWLFLVKYELDLIKKNCFHLFDDIHNQTFFDENFFDIILILKKTISS